jgi:hypothetical protein
MPPDMVEKKRAREVKGEKLGCFEETLAAAKEMGGWRRRRRSGDESSGLLLVILFIHFLNANYDFVDFFRWTAKVEFVVFWGGICKLGKSLIVWALY